jgi:integrase
MPKLASAFTAHTAVKAQPKDKPYELRDGACRGLILRVQPTGAKIWYVSLKGGKRHTLGRAPAMTLTQAREYAKLARLRGGIPDPEDDKPSEVPTLGVFLYGTGENDKDAARRYKPYFEATHRRAKQHLNNLNLFGEFSATRLDLLTEDVLDAWMRKRLRTASKATVKRNIGALKAALKQAVRWKVIPVSPLEHHKPGALKNADVKRIRYLTPAEEKRLRKSLSAVPKYFCAMVLLALNTGARRGELFQLRWKDVDYKGRQVLLRAETTKSEKARHIPLNDEAMKVLKSLKQGEPDDPVFPGRRYDKESGRKKPLNNTAGLWNALLKKAEIADLHFHDLRHTFASKLVQRGKSLYTVQELLGHSDPKLTARYAHLASKHLRDAVEAL